MKSIRGAAIVEYTLVVLVCSIALLMPVNDDFQPASGGKNVVVRFTEAMRENHSAYSKTISISNIVE
ncbi:hypothetical protein D1Z90_17910 [Motilimonas pumila]|uniref:Uncharacterized protein n=1 Tax=Motilimonas pumila TaxID=2303987 RepID=A0A418YAG0_9GAMM|nr:hypothetical protein D1Z90_17910 [Motilimonas pumila]